VEELAQGKNVCGSRENHDPVPNLLVVRTGKHLRAVFSKESKTFTHLFYSKEHCVPKATRERETQTPKDSI